MARQLVTAGTEPNSSLILWRICALIWAGLIFHLSTPVFGQATSHWLLARALALVHLRLSLVTFDTVHEVLRKFAHVAEYAMLGFLLHRSLSARWRLGEQKRALLCILVAAAYSLTDEFHQLFAPGRHASLVDCAFDSAGAALAVFLAVAYRRLVTCRQEEEGLAAMSPLLAPVPPVRSTQDLECLE